MQPQELLQGHRPQEPSAAAAGHRAQVLGSEPKHRLPVARACRPVPSQQVRRQAQRSPLCGVPKPAPPALGLLGQGTLVAGSRPFFLRPLRQQEEVLTNSPSLPLFLQLNSSGSLTLAGQRLELDGSHSQQRRPRSTPTRRRPARTSQDVLRESMQTMRQSFVSVRSPTGTAPGGFSRHPPSLTFFWCWWVLHAVRSQKHIGKTDPRKPPRKGHTVGNRPQRGVNDFEEVSPPTPSHFLRTGREG